MRVDGVHIHTDFLMMQQKFLKEKLRKVNFFVIGKLLFFLVLNL